MNSVANNSFIVSLESRMLFSTYSAVLLQPAAGTGTFDREGGTAMSGSYVAGNYEGASSLNSYLYNPKTNKATALSVISGDNFSEAHGVNAKGQTVGISYNSAVGYTSETAVLWNTAGKLTKLGKGQANAVNDSGQAVGVYNMTAVKYSGGKAVAITDLGGSISVANDINNSGVIVGTSNTTGDVARKPFLLSGGHAIDIAPGYQTGEGYAVNAAGHAVGQVDTTNAFVYAGSKTTLLPSISSFVSTSQANDINASDEIVGTSTVATSGQPSYSATLWIGGKAYNLNSLLGTKGIVLTTALSINDSGQILAYGTENFQPGTFLLTPQRGALSSKGRLSVAGSDGADTITLSRSGGNLVLSVNGLSQTFAASKVKSISISALGGNDKISVGAGVQGVKIDAGAGNDSVTGGAGNDTLIGGTGADKLNGGAGKDTSDKDAKDQRIAIEILG